jgi:hypothetical protein
VTRAEVRVRDLVLHRALHGDGVAAYLVAHVAVQAFERAAERAESGGGLAELLRPLSTVSSPSASPSYAK